jgi:hypothetical protein
MPWLTRIFTRTANPHSSETATLNRYEGFTASGGIMLRDRRGTLKGEIPDTD